MSPRTAIVLVTLAWVPIVLTFEPAALAFAGAALAFILTCALLPEKQHGPCIDHETLTTAPNRK